VERVRVLGRADAAPIEDERAAEQGDACLGLALVHAYAEHFRAERGNLFTVARLTRPWPGAGASQGREREEDNHGSTEILSHHY